MSALWNGLREEQRVAWRRLAQTSRSRSNVGPPASLDGPLLFKKINRVLATCGREPLLDPPPLPKFGPNPVEGFTISQGKHSPVFKLKVSRAFRWEDRSPLEDIMVYGWAPYPAGVDKNTLYVFLGTARPPKGGEIEFTELYLKKLMEWRKLKHRR